MALTSISSMNSLVTAGRGVQRMSSSSSMAAAGGGQRQQRPSRHCVVVRAAAASDETNNIVALQLAAADDDHAGLNAFQRHARAAAKYATGPVSRPADLALHLKPAAERALLGGGSSSSATAVVDLKAAVAALSAAAAQQPHLYAYKLASDRTKRAAESSRVQWSEIL